MRNVEISDEILNDNKKGPCIVPFPLFSTYNKQKASTMHTFKNIFSLFFIYHSRLSAAMVRRRVFFGTVIQIFPTEGKNVSHGGKEKFPRRERKVPTEGKNVSHGGKKRFPRREKSYVRIPLPADMAESCKFFAPIGLSSQYFYLNL